MEIRIKKLHPDAAAPEYATDGSGCFDLRAVDLVEPMGISDDRPALLRTGLAFEIPADHVMMVFSRSGHGFNHNVRLANAVGIIDADYRGEVKVKLTKDGLGGYMVEPGERIAQACIVKTERVSFLLADELSDTARGDGGFGSTGAVELALATITNTEATSAEDRAPEVVDAPADVATAE